MLHLVANPNPSNARGESLIHIAMSDTTLLPAFAGALCRKKPGPTTTGWRKASTEATCPACIKRFNVMAKRGKV